jgi:arabinose-5-phosphate isomerase
MDSLKADLRATFDYFCTNLPYEQIERLVDALQSIPGNIYFLGTGKSGNMARHCADLLKCISLPAFYADTTDLLHGSIGCISEKDMVVLFSRSGSTAELIALVPYLKARRVKLWGVINAPTSKLADLCEDTVNLPFRGEMPGEIDQIPTHSCLAQLLFANVLVSRLKGSLPLAQYALNHPAGAIGSALSTVREVLVPLGQFPRIVLDDGVAVPLHDVFFQMTRWKMGACFFTTPEGGLEGLLTDGDIRRLLLADPGRTAVFSADINQTCYTETDLGKFIRDCKPFHFIPVVDPKSRVLLGIVFNACQDCVRVSA